MDKGADGQVEGVDRFCSNICKQQQKNEKNLHFTRLIGRVKWGV